MPRTGADLSRKHSPFGVEGKRTEMDELIEAIEAHKKSL